MAPEDYISQVPLIPTNYISQARLRQWEAWREIGGPEKKEARVFLPLSPVWVFLAVAVVSASVVSAPLRVPTMVHSAPARWP